MTRAEIVRRIETKHADKVRLISRGVSYVREKANFSCTVCSWKFEKIIYKVLDGEGCPNCSKRPRYTTESWIAEAKKRRGNEFDYANVVYTNAHARVELIHRECGNKITQEAFSHLRGAGCQFCGGNPRRGKEGFVEDSERVHGKGKFSYDDVEYVNSYTHVWLTCLKCNYEFRQIPGNHIHCKSGCPRCVNSNSSLREKAWLDSLDIPDENRQARIPNTRWIADALVGNTIYEFFGTFWHGDPRVHSPEKINKKVGETFGELHARTLFREKTLRELGYSLVTIWELDWKASQRKIVP